MKALTPAPPALVFLEAAPTRPGLPPAPARAVTGAPSAMKPCRVSRTPASTMGHVRSLEEASHAIAPPVSMGISANLCVLVSPIPVRLAKPAPRSVGRPCALALLGSREPTAPKSTSASRWVAMTAEFAMTPPGSLFVSVKQATMAPLASSWTPAFQLLAKTMAPAPRSTTPSPAPARSWALQETSASSLTPASPTPARTMPPAPTSGAPLPVAASMEPPEAFAPLLIPASSTPADPVRSVLTWEAFPSAFALRASGVRTVPLLIRAIPIHAPMLDPAMPRRPASTAPVRSVIMATTAPSMMEISAPQTPASMANASMGWGSSPASANQASTGPGASTTLTSAPPTPASTGAAAPRGSTASAATAQ